MKQTMKQTMKLVGCLGLLALTSSSAKAFTYSFFDLGQIKFGTTSVTSNTEFALGYFTGSISSSGSQVDLANFVNLNSNGSGGVGWSMAMDAGEGSWLITAGSAPMTANTGGLQPIAGTALYFVGRSVSDAPAGQGPFSFAVGNSEWVVKTNGGTDLGDPTSYSWGDPGTFTFSKVNFSTSGVSLSSPGGLATLTMADLSAIPEPSVASLLALGTVGLVALRVRRKS